MSQDRPEIKSDLRVDLICNIATDTVENCECTARVVLLPCVDLQRFPVYYDNISASRNGSLDLAAADECVSTTHEGGLSIYSVRSTNSERLRQESEFS
jgi:hypothetical protein